MKSFYGWLNENENTSSQLNTSIVDSVNRFLTNFKPSKGNEKNFLHIKKYTDELERYPIVNYNNYNLDTTIVPAFQQISQLNKNSSPRNYAPLVRRILTRIDILSNSDLLYRFSKIIDLILVGIVRLYHQEIYLLNREAIETVIENIIYDFNLNKSIINKIRISLAQFEFENLFQIFEINVKEEIEEFVSLNEFDNIPKEGIIQALYRFNKLISDASSNQNLSYEIKYIMNRL